MSTVKHTKEPSKSTKYRKLNSLKEELNVKIKKKESPYITPKSVLLQQHQNWVHSSKGFNIKEEKDPFPITLYTNQKRVGISQTYT